MLQLKKPYGTIIVDFSRRWYLHKKDSDQLYYGFELEMGHKKPTREDVKTIREIFKNDADEILDELKRMRNRNAYFQNLREKRWAENDRMKRFGLNPNSEDDVKKYFSHKGSLDDYENREIITAIFQIIMTVTMITVAFMALHN